MFKQYNQEIGVTPLKFNIYECAENMSNKEYHSREEISSSFIKNVSKHSVGRASIPLDTSGALGQALIMGDAFHEYMELDSISDRFVIKPDSLNLSTKAGKVWKASIDPSKHIITESDLTDIKGMHLSVNNDPFVKKIKQTEESCKIADVDFQLRDEWSFFAEGDDEHTRGLKFRIRPDRHISIDDSVDWIIDWKSTNDLMKLIRWGFIDLGYDQQAVFYSDFIGIDPSKFVFVCVEKKPPYSCRPIFMSQDTIVSARIKLIKTIDRIRKAKNGGSIDINLPTEVII